MLILTFPSFQLVYYLCSPHTSRSSYMNIPPFIFRNAKQTNTSVALTLFSIPFTFVNRYYARYFRLQEFSVIQTRTLTNQSHFTITSPPLFFFRNPTASHLTYQIFLFLFYISSTPLSPLYLQFILLVLPISFLLR